MLCYSCGENYDRLGLKDFFYGLNVKMEPGSKSLVLNVELKSGGLCKKCSILAFEACAKKLKQMEEEDFRMEMWE